MKKNTITIKNGRINREKCLSCGQLMRRKKLPPLSTPDVNKMRKIMKKNNLTQMKLAEIIGISQGTVQGWFTASRNLKGRIKKIYFEILKSRGY